MNLPKTFLALSNCALDHGLQGDFKNKFSLDFLQYVHSNMNTRHLSVPFLVTIERGLSI